MTGIGIDLVGVHELPHYMVLAIPYIHCIATHCITTTAIVDLCQCVYVHQSTTITTIGIGIGMDSVESIAMDDKLIAM